MLTEDDKKELRAKTDKPAQITAECHRIHRAVMDGTVDKPTVVDALARIAVLNEQPEKAVKEPSTAQKIFNPQAAREQQLAADNARLATDTAQRDRDAAAV